MRTAIYARSAVASRGAIDEQIAICKRWANQEGWSLSDEHIYVDNGFGGIRAEGRPALESLLKTAAASPPPFDVVLIEAVARLGRSQLGMPPVIEQLRHLGIFVYAIDSGYDSRAPR
jgi:DNA invertase Pin-like site-specific DNA recombinase